MRRCKNRSVGKSLELVFGFGLTRQPEKEKALYLGTDATALAAVTAGAGERHMRVTTEGIIVAGSPVGTDAYVAQHLTEQADAIIAMLGRIRDLADESLGSPCLAAPPMHMPHAPAAHGGVAPPDLNALDVVGAVGAFQRIFALIRMCVSSRFGHLLRTVMPELTELPARRIDDAVFRTVMHILGHHPDAFPTGGLGLATRARVFLPISSGGFGFTSCEFTRHAAYVASVLLCAPHINNTEPLVPGGDAAVGPAAD